MGVKVAWLPLRSVGLNRFRYDLRLTNRTSAVNRANLVIALRKCFKTVHEEWYIRVTECVAFHLYLMALKENKWCTLKEGDWNEKDLVCLRELEIPFFRTTGKFGEVVRVQPRDDQYQAIYYLIGDRKEDEKWRQIALRSGFKEPSREGRGPGRPERWYKPPTYQRNRATTMKVRPGERERVQKAVEDITS